ncbi:hypothetical protein IB276_17765 [Ensifer sp. ENS04]|uniref:hypothetical protein n=1 Tax=Ensifer sp. ENS04 TaxID=2769281 RepID=UPI0017818E5E|nr:hypothetical protein [Ensifer sp. ENS04]MBD9541305.1 hypothetical protein [Ensifer sp. ENS04]
MIGISLTSNATVLLRDVERAHAVGENIATLEPVFSKEKQPDGRGPIDPARVFRSHREDRHDKIRKQEGRWREALDLLLGGLSALHIGGLQANDAEVWRDPESRSVWNWLCHPAVVAYYERHYPFAPPLLIRAAGEGRLPEAYRAQWQTELAQDGFAAAYRQFLHLNARFIADDVIGHFIALLDDFRVFGTRLDDFRQVLEQPRQLEEWLAQEARWKLLDGMASFYEFTLDLDGYLASLEFPVLRGHVWLHFAYWLGNGGSRMEEVALWLQNDAAHIAAYKPIAGAELSGALARLRDPKQYPEALIVQTADLLRPWLESSGVGRQSSASG